MTTGQEKPEQHVFEADVSRLLHMMVHSVYSDKDVFLRELISNAADACEKLRYEAISQPQLIADGGAPQILVSLDEDSSSLVVEDNGIGMGHDGDDRCARNDCPIGNARFHGAPGGRQSRRKS